MVTTSRPSLSVRVYGLAALIAGIAGVRWAKLAPTWQLLGSGSSHASAWAVGIALVLIIGGAAVQLRRTVSVGLLVLGLAYAIAVVLWLERFVTGSTSVGYWLSLAEAGAQFIAAAAAYQLSRQTLTGAPSYRRALTIPFGLCVIAFGASHFAALAFTSTLVPAWVPLGGRSWAIFTALAHIAAGLAIATEVLGYLAARLLTLMIFAFGALVWLPVLIANPHAFANWASNADNLSIAASAWIIADMLHDSMKRDVG